MNQYNPDYVTPPGESIKDVLEALSMTAEDLIEVFSEEGGQEEGAQFVSDLLQSKQRITNTIACGLAILTGVPVSFWLNCQLHYDESSYPELDIYLQGPVETSAEFGDE